MKKLLPIILSVLMLTACGGDKKIDASSEESLKSSVQELTDTLNAKEKAAFDKAINKFAFVSAVEATNSGEDIKLIIKRKLDGKTASEVIKEAEKLKIPNPILRPNN